MTMMAGSVMTGGGVGGNYRASYNCERDQGKQCIAKHLHDDKPQKNQPGRPAFRTVRYNAA
jgi:hypothetical protein